MTTNLKNIKAPTSNYKQSFTRLEFSSLLKKISKFSLISFCVMLKDYMVKSVDLQFTPVEGWLTFPIPLGVKEWEI